MDWTGLYPRCSVAVPLSFLPLHQSHGSQRLPVVSSQNIRAMRPPPPVATPLPSVHLHADWLAVFIYKVQLVRAATARWFARFDLQRWERTDLLRWDGGCSDRLCGSVGVRPPSSGQPDSPVLSVLHKRKHESASLNKGERRKRYAQPCHHVASVDPAN